MNHFALKVLALGLGALCTHALRAQPAEPEKVSGTLEVIKGSVMTSDGGKFVSGHTGQKVTIDDRVMVAKDSSARIAFGDHCSRTFDAPGVFTIDGTCDGGLAPGAAGAASVAASVGTGTVLSGSAVAAVAVTGGLIGAAIIKSNQGSADPPISH